MRAALSARRAPAAVALATLLSGVAGVGATSAQPAGDASPHRAVLDRYCVACHNERLRTAGLALDEADLAHVATDSPIWEQVIRKLRVGAMPPPGRPRPDRATPGPWWPIWRRGSTGPPPSTPGWAAPRRSTA